MRLLQHGYASRESFDPVYVQSLINEHLSLRRDHAHKLWQLLMFQLWADRYLSTSSAEPNSSLATLRSS